jgi:signal transduction histidine kinase
LYLAVVPAILGLFTVAALAYWGHMYRRAPGWVVAAAAVAAVGSLILAWRNTRYVARRLERLVGRPSPSGAPDELDSIEAVVDRLTGAVTEAEADSRRREVAATQRISEYAALLSEASSALSRQLDEVRLPLHILLENHFGPLNENQEEMLAGAHTAAEAADLELRRLRDIADLDRGALSLRREQVRLGELLRALKPQLEADGERAGVTVALDVTPGLPRVAGDRVRLQEALERLLRYLVRHATPGNAISIAVGTEAGQIVLTVEGGPALTLDADIALARRIILAHRGTLDDQASRTRVAFPAYKAI